MLLRAKTSHLLGLFLLLVVVVVVVVCLIFLSFLVILRFLCCIFLGFLGLLQFAQSLPPLCKSLCFGCVIGYDYIVKNGAPLALPQIESDETEIVILVQGVIILVLRICNLLGLPNALVGRIGDS